MQLTGELAPLGYAHRETEFIIAPAGGPVAGQRIYGCCGPTALASAASAALQRLVTSEQVYALCVARGLCDAQGVSNDVHLAQAAPLLGLTIIQHQVYAGDAWSGWQTFLGWNLGSRSYPTLIEVARGQQLVDAITGLGENASGLTYHFLMLLKRWNGGYSQAAGKNLPAGFWACDGDNYAGGNSRAYGFAASDSLQFYSDDVLAAAMPCAAISFGRVTTAPPPAPTGGSSMWTRDATGAHDENGHTVGQGVADAIFAQNWQASNGLTSEHYYSPNASVTALANGHTICWEGGANVDLAADAVAALLGQLTSANAEIATLKATPPPAPVTVPAPFTPQQTNDLAVMAAIRAALA